MSVAAHCAARSLRGGGGRGGGRELQLDDLLDARSALGEVEDVGALGQARAHLVRVRARVRVRVRVRARARVRIKVVGSGSGSG